MRLASTRVLFLAALLSVGVLVPCGAHATGVGDEGCTPGYWKNHTDNWLENSAGDPSYDPGEWFGDVFGVDHGSVTLLQALDGAGGPGIAGAKRILARTATAALLNAAHDDLQYPLRRNQATDDGPAIIAGVQDVWDSGDRDEILELARLFDDLNNLGCPLN